MLKKTLLSCLVVLGFSLSFGAFSQADVPTACTALLSAPQFNTKVESFDRGVVLLDELDHKSHSRAQVKYMSLKTVNGQQYTEQELFNDKSDLIIGIDTMGKTKGHMYLIINGEARVDGRMFFAPSTVDSKNLELSDGLILRYKNLPPENKQKLLAWLASPDDVHGPTCIAVGSKIVFDIGDLAPDAKNYWFPSTFLRYMATKGLLGADGQTLTPDIYLINSEIHTFWYSLPHWQSVPKFLFQVLLDPYTWQGLKNRHRDRPDLSSP